MSLESTICTVFLSSLPSILCDCVQHHLLYAHQLYRTHSTNREMHTLRFGKLRQVINTSSNQPMQESVLKLKLMVIAHLTFTSLQFLFYSNGSVTLWHCGTVVFSMTTFPCPYSMAVADIICAPTLFKIYLRHIWNLKTHVLSLHSFSSELHCPAEIFNYHFTIQG